jgi:hypothetical protein
MTLRVTSTGAARSASPIAGLDGCSPQRSVCSWEKRSGLTPGCDKGRVDCCVVTRLVIENLSEWLVLRFKVNLLGVSRPQQWFVSTSSHNELAKIRTL